MEECGLKKKKKKRNTVDKRWKILISMFFVFLQVILQIFSIKIPRWSVRKIEENI